MDTDQESLLTQMNRLYQMSDRKVEPIDLETMTDYITEMQEVLKEGTLTERRAFIRSFVKEIKVVGNQSVLIQ